MATSKMTLIGFNNWMLNNNDDLFAFLTVPAGIDKDLLINNILMKGGEFEVLYSDPDFMKNMVGVWSHKWQHTMKRWIDALSIDYNPLENYDRMENWTDVNVRENRTDASDSRNSTNIKSGQNERNENANAVDNSTSSGSGVTENTRSAFDSTSYQPHDKSTTSSTGTNSSVGSTQAKADSKDFENTVTTDAGSNNALNKNNELLNKTGRAHGNIGVTTSQQMLQSELDLYFWNLYDEIADLFLNEFCIYVY